jgi:hypothetical protein
MKPYTLALIVFCALGAACFAGTDRYSGKEMKEVAPVPCAEFYGDREFTVSVWGAYAFSSTENDRTSIEDTDDIGIFGTYDRFLAEDHAWGGGIDAKYFFMRYFGVGVEGLALSGHSKRARLDGGPDATANEEFYEGDNHLVGGALGTLTLRYPFHCSRFAPYVWVGGGGYFGGKNDRLNSVGGGEGGRFTLTDYQDESRFAGQFGGGLEYRITRHIGVTGDFSWNVLDGSHNNFGMVRTGLTFGF